jgi:glycosyltransferase 2 family protein
VPIAIVGILAGIALVAHYGVRDVGGILVTVGWGGFVVVVLLHVAGIVLLGLCWFLLAPDAGRFSAFAWGRLIRDSASEVLPLSQIGGFAMGARAAALMGLPGAVAAASTVVDVTLETLAQLAYTAVGLALVVHLHAGGPLVLWVALGLSVGLIAIAAFVALQRHAVRLAEHPLCSLIWRLGRGAFTPVRAAAAEMASIHRRRRPIALAVFLHFGAWLASGCEAWIALRLMGVQVGLLPVIAIESLLFALRSVAFFVPGAIGVQEGAYVLLGAGFGLPPQVVLALSLLKRARDLVIGVPALVGWQMQEARRLLRGSSRAVRTVSSASSE